MTLTPEQTKDYEFFQANLDKWMDDIAYRGKHVVIANQKVQGVFDEFSTAYEFAAFRFVGGYFIIQEVTDYKDRNFSTHYSLPRTSVAVYDDGLVNVMGSSS